MTKIVRYIGDLPTFGSTATGTERTIFGDTAQWDTLTKNMETVDFKRGWGIVGANDAPAKQDFNGLGYTLSLLLSYLHQMGVPEWAALQEYHLGAVATIGGVVYVSMINTNTGNNPATDYTNWKDISGSRNVVQTTDATVTAIATIAVPDNSCIVVEARINGIIDDYSAAIGGKIIYTVRRAVGVAIEVGVPDIVSAHDSGTGVPAIDSDVSGGNLRILVSGVAAETYDWSCSYSYNFIV